MLFGGLRNPTFSYLRSKLEFPASCSTAASSRRIQLTLAKKRTAPPRPRNSFAKPLRREWNNGNSLARAVLVAGHADGCAIVANLCAKPKHGRYGSLGRRQQRFDDVDSARAGPAASRCLAGSRRHRSHANREVEGGQRIEAAGAKQR